MRKKMVRILTGVGILIVALAVIYAIAVGVSALKLRRAYAALERDGRPVKAADIIPAQIPDTENAALLYESAFLLLKAQPAGDKDLLGRLGALSMEYVNGVADPNERAELQRLLQLEAVATALQTVQRGTTRPACHFEQDYSGEVLLSPYLNDLRAFSRILAAKVMIDAEAGRTADAWNMAATQLRFADALRTEPAFIVSQLVRAAQIDIACTCVQKLCDNSTPDEEQSQAIQGLLGRFDDITPIVLAVDSERLLFGERLFNLPPGKMRKSLLEIIGQDYVPDIVRELKIRWITLRPLVLADHAAFLNQMRDYARQLSEPYRPGEFQAVERSLSRACQRHRITGFITPAMGRVKEIYLRMVAESRMTRTGLALLQYRKTHGAFPDGLDAVALPYAQDPFSQKPLLYRPEPHGFVLYSIGPDQKDNGGTPKPPKGDAEYDLVWHSPSQQAN